MICKGYCVTSGNLTVRLHKENSSETILYNDSIIVLSPVYIRTVAQLKLCTRDAGTPTMRFNMADPEVVFLALRRRCSGQQSLKRLAVLRRRSTRRKVLLFLILSTFLMCVMTERMPRMVHACSRTHGVSREPPHGRRPL